MNRIVGDTVPINGVSFIDKCRPLDWTATGYTPKLSIETDSGTEVLAATSITPHPTQAVTLDSTNNWITCNDHGYSTETRAGSADQVVFATSGSLAGTGLTAAQRYWVVEVDGNWFRVSLRSGGAAITIAAAGTGPHTVYRVGSWQATNAQASLSSLVPGRYVAHVAAFNGSTQIETAPALKDGFSIDVLTRGN